MQEGEASEEDGEEEDGEEEIVEHQSQDDAESETTLILGEQVVEEKGEDDGECEECEDDGEECEDDGEECEGEIHDQDLPALTPGSTPETEEDSDSQAPVMSSQEERPDGVSSRPEITEMVIGLLQYFGKVYPDIARLFGWCSSMFSYHQHFVLVF